MQQRNFLLFLLLSFVLLLGYIQLRQRLWPPEEPPEKPAKTAKKEEGKKPEEKKQEPANLYIPAPPPVTPDAELITLGADDEFAMRVVLDPHGAGVRQVVLKKFQEADWRGRPVWKDRANR